MNGGGSVPEASDDDLVERTAQGDTAAFAQLVARHRSRLMALATRALGSRVSAEDIVQEVFTRAWIGAPRWQARGAARASYASWLSRVAVNLVIDQSRRLRPLPLDEIEEPEDTSVLPDAAIMAQEHRARIAAAIAALPARQRIAIGLTYDADMSNAEGAAAMGISVGAFELLLVRARRVLRETLREPQ